MFEKVAPYDNLSFDKSKEVSRQASTFETPIRKFKSTMPSINTDKGQKQNKWKTPVIIEEELQVDESDDENSKKKDIDCDSSESHCSALSKLSALLGSKKNKTAPTGPNFKAVALNLQAVRQVRKDSYISLFKLKEDQAEQLDRLVHKKEYFVDNKISQ